MNVYFLDLLQGSGGFLLGGNREKGEKRESVTSHTLTTNRCFHLPNGNIYSTLCSRSRNNFIYRGKTKYSLWKYKSIITFKITTSYEAIQVNLRQEGYFDVGWGSSEYIVRHWLEKLDLDQLLSSSLILKSNLIKRHAIIL
jgi:hypothetical protein